MFKTISKSFKNSSNLLAANFLKKFWKNPKSNFLKKFWKNPKSNFFKKFWKNPKSKVLEKS